MSVFKLSAKTFSDGLDFSIFAFFFTQKDGDHADIASLSDMFEGAPLIEDLWRFLIWSRLCIIICVQ